MNALPCVALNAPMSAVVIPAIADVLSAGIPVVLERAANPVGDMEAICVLVRAPACAVVSAVNSVADRPAMDVGAIAPTCAVVKAPTWVVSAK